MTRTIYEPDNANFSELAHLAAQKQLYPSIFKQPFSALVFISATSSINQKINILDREMGIDRIVNVFVKGFHKSFSFTVQERFRRPEYAKYKDVTITEWNNASSSPSELYKINAGIFLYGYYDLQAKSFLDAVAIDTSKLLLLLARQQLYFRRRRNNKLQDFIAIPFDELENKGVVLFRLTGEEAVR